MATNYKNILLKDNSGQVLLPITLSYYVEYKDGMSVKSYLDTLGNSLADVNVSIGDINTAIDDIEDKIAQHGEVEQNIISTVNDILTSYVTKPEYAYAVVFDNTTNTNLSDNLKNLTADPTLQHVSTQQAIEALDARVTSVNSYASDLGNRIDTIDSDIDALETSLSGIDTRISNVETESDYSYSKINELFDGSGNLDLTASAVKYIGNADSGTETLVGNRANVQDAIDFIGSQLQTIKDGYDGIASQAGVTYVTGQGGILVNDRNNERQQGAVVVKLNLDNDKVILNGSTVTVDDSKLSITASQISGLIPAEKIEGGLDADNITITYTYTGEGDVIHNDGEKSLQEFYNEYDTNITQISEKVSGIESSYLVSVTGADDSTYARVYTITQGGRNVGTINIPKDQFLKNVDYVDAEHAPEGAPEGVYPALVFTWNLSDSDETTGAPTSYVPIASFVDAITSKISSDVTALDGRVTTLETKVEALETASATHITGATINGQAVNVVDHVLQLSYNILYESGSLTDGVSDGFLTANGITLS